MKNVQGDVTRTIQQATRNEIACMKEAQKLAAEMIRKQRESGEWPVDSRFRRR